MCDTVAEARLGGELVVEVEPVGVAGDAGEGHHVLVCYLLAEPDVVAHAEVLPVVDGPLRLPAGTAERHLVAVGRPGSGVLIEPRYEGTVGPRDTAVHLSDAPGHLPARPGPRRRELADRRRRVVAPVSIHTDRLTTARFITCDSVPRDARSPVLYTIEYPSMGTEVTVIRMAPEVPCTDDRRGRRDDVDAGCLRPAVPGVERGRRRATDGAVPAVRRRRRERLRRLLRARLDVHGHCGVQDASPERRPHLYPRRRARGARHRRGRHRPDRRHPSQTERGLR